ncbi:MAG: FAD-dependent oxidoreductase [Gammaproteobacteria bacterium]
MSKTKIILALTIAVLVSAYFLLDIGQYLSLEYLKSQQERLQDFRRAEPLKTAAVYFAAYIAVTALSLPGAAVMTLIGGAVFGLLWGVLLVSFASTIGATLAFLVSRHLLRDVVQSKFGGHLQAINRGIEKDGPFYLFALRLVPAFPFFVINLVMGLTPLSTLQFYWVSQIGMLAGTAVYVNAGVQLAGLDSVNGILSPGLLVSFAILGLFPLLAKKTLDIIHSGKMLRAYPRPHKFDRDLIVIGAGAAGLVSAYIAAAVKAKVTLIEKHKMGGDCLNTGCVPSKALLRSAKFLHQIGRAPDYGFKSATADFDFADIMDRVRRAVETIAPHDSVERYSGLGVDCIEGTARIASPYCVEVNGKALTTRNIVIATGAAPFVPPIPGIEDTGYLTSDTVWGLRRLPQRLVVLGGGPIGCELSQAFARFGSKVTLVEMLPRLLIREDPEVSEIVERKLAGEGIDLLLGHKAERFESGPDRKILHCSSGDAKVAVEFDELLVAVGRKANASGFGLEELGVPIRPNGTVEVDEWLRTVYPNIYACGDVAGPYQFTHTAAHQAWYAVVNALFGGFKKFKADYSVVPWATFTDPEVARVGLNELEAKEKKIPYEVTCYGIDDLDRAIVDEEAHGMVKVLTVPGKDRILGVTIVGEHAGDLIAEYVAAMRHGFGMNKILGTIHIYPTLAEANKFAAGEWKRNHAPAAALRWLEKYFAWRRGA